LEGVKHVNRACETDGVYGTEGAFDRIFHDFQNSRTFTPPRLCCGMLAAKLGYRKKILENNY